jgi:hypothetical protein
MICVTNLLILFIILGHLIANGPEFYDAKRETPNYIESHSIFNSAPEFCFTFHFQIYFLIVLQYVSERKKLANSYIIGAATNLTVLVFCFVYSLLSLSTSIVFTSFKDAIYNRLGLAN